MYEYNVEIRRVVDGDTIDVLIDLGFGIQMAERVRLAGVDTPESRTRNLREKKYGKLATARVSELLPVGDTVKAMSRSYNSKGKFGRAMFDFCLQDGRVLSDVLVAEYLAVKYHGQSKDDVKDAHEANWNILEAQLTNLVVT